MKKVYLAAVLVFIIAIGWGWKFIFSFHSQYVQPLHGSNLLTPYQFLQLTIATIGTTGTFLAVLVALFKDQLNSLFRRPEIILRAKEEDHISESFFPPSDSITTPACQLYETIITIENTGNQMAENCVFILQELKFKELNGQVEKLIEIPTSEFPLWRRENQAAITVYPKHKVEANMLKMEYADLTTPQGGQTVIPTLIIGGVIVNSNSETGIWQATFGLFSKNCDSIHYKLQVEWNGRWKARWTEMKNELKVKKI